LSLQGLSPVLHQLISGSSISIHHLAVPGQFTARSSNCAEIRGALGLGMQLTVWKRGGGHGGGCNNTSCPMVVRLMPHMCVNELLAWPVMNIPPVTATIWMANQKAYLDNIIRADR